MQFNFTLILLVKTCIYVRNGKAETKHFFSAMFYHKLKSTSARLLHFLQQKKKRSRCKAFLRISVVSITHFLSHTQNLDASILLMGVTKGWLGVWLVSGMKRHFIIFQWFYIVTKYFNTRIQQNV